MSSLAVEHFDFDEQALNHLLESPDGPVGKDLQRRAENVTAQATENATGIGVAGASNPQGRGPNIRTGNLNTSIRFVIGHDDDGLFAEIGSDVLYAIFLETGLRNGATYPFLLPALPAAAS